MTEERFLITGALGCIGAWAMRALVREGAHVVGFDLGTDRRRAGLVMTPEELAAVTFVQGDITRKEAIDAALDGHAITHVIHLAALQLPYCKADPVLGAQVNVVGTVNVFQAVAERKDRVVRIAYASSTAAFNEFDGQDGPVASDAVTTPLNLYGVYKVANEGTARVFWHDQGVPSVGLRPYVLYGVGRDRGFTATPSLGMLAAGLGVPYEISYGGRLQFQFAGDIADLFVRAARTDHPGASVFNTGGAVHHVADVVAAIDAAAPEQAGNVTFAQAPIPFPPEFDGEALAAALGPLPATPLEVGVAQTVKRFRELGQQGLVTAADLA